MSLIINKGKAIKEELGIDADFQRGEVLSRDFLNHIDKYHSLDERFDREIEIAWLDDEEQNIKNPKKIDFVRGLPTFSPSGASKCERELYYKAKREDKDEQPFFPYQKRWVRNGSTVHGAMQKDLLYAEKYLKDPKFTVVRMKAPASVAGRPAWEHNLKNVKAFPELGFQIFGMMDGVLEYTPDRSKVGFEFKTKSTTISVLGNYKMKEAQADHVQQVTAYSILFGLEEFLLVYESLAKDGWNKGEEAKPDVRAFTVKVSEEQRQELLAKFQRVAEAVKTDTLPPADYSKCIFCPYKEICGSEANE